jgi:peroxiredoxin-like protein
MEEISHTYNINIKWNEGRLGTMSSPELEAELDVATPPQFQGGVAGVWSPEHLFVASLASCFMTTFLAIADYSGLKFESLEIRSAGKLEKSEKIMLMTEIKISPVLTITVESGMEKALKILEKAKKACLISNSVTSSVILEPEVVIHDPAASL